MPVLREPIHAPEFQRGEWLNSSPLSMAALRGKVVLVDFWDYCCINCLRTLPYVQEWWQRYRHLDFMIVGVHTPEFSFGKSPVLVQNALERLGIEYPVLLDNEHKTWQVWANRYWPAKYLVDSRGYVTYFHFGEGYYQDLECAIQTLLCPLHPDIDFPDPVPPKHAADIQGAVCSRATPEMYLGYERGRIGNPEGYLPNQVVTYTEVLTEREGLCFLQGIWFNGSEALTLTAGEGVVRFTYHAKKVQIVAAPPAGATAIIAIEQDGQPLTAEHAADDVQIEDGQSIVHLEMPRMYQLIQNPHQQTHQLTLRIRTPDTALYTVTFVPECISQAPSSEEAA